MGRDVDLLGRGLYLEAALFNHSCSPNCSVSAGARTLEVVVDEVVARTYEGRTIPEQLPVQSSGSNRVVERDVQEVERGLELST